MRSIAISSGHGKYVRGASGYVDEVDEARRVVNEVTRMINANGGRAVAFHDDTSKSQSENLNTITSWHNRQNRDLDVSIHFNAYQTTSSPRGVECLYYSQQSLASAVAARTSRDGSLINRGAKKRTDLAFLNNTNKPAILHEVCFVDSTADIDLYRRHFEAICAGIAEEIGGMALTVPIDPIPIPPEPVEPNEPLPGDGEALFRTTGKMSTFGGPDDKGVSPSEGLAFFNNVMDKPVLFLPYQPSGTTGLARRMNVETNYVACRWDYAKTPKAVLAGPQLALVRSSKTGREILAMPGDWGPNENTGRVADLSPSLARNLGVKTDDEVEVIYPFAGTSVS